MRGSISSDYPRRPDDRAFTEYIRALDPRGPGPTEEVVTAALGKLRQILRRELSKRSLWHVPPSRLGIYGASSWAEGDAMEELIADCHKFVIADRLEGYRAYLNDSANIDGLIHKIIRDFLHERQRAHDPLGFTIFKLLNMAVRKLIEMNKIFTLCGGSRIQNGTTLVFNSTELTKSATSSDYETLLEIVKQWNDEIFPELLFSTGAKGGAKMAGRIGDFILRLVDYGVDKFQFQNLCNAMKADARDRLLSYRSQSQKDWAIDGVDDGGSDLRAGDVYTVVPVVYPDPRVENHDALEKFVERMDELIDNFDARGKNQEKKKIYLQRLWSFIKLRQSEESWRGDMPPAARKLSKLLDIPRERIGELLDDIRRFALQCQENAIDQREE